MSVGGEIRTRSVKLFNNIRRSSILFKGQCYPQQVDDRPSLDGVVIRHLVL